MNKRSICCTTKQSCVHYNKTEDNAQHNNNVLTKVRLTTTHNSTLSRRIFEKVTEHVTTHNVVHKTIHLMDCATKKKKYNSPHFGSRTELRVVLNLWFGSAGSQCHNATVVKCKRNHLT